MRAGRRIVMIAAMAGLALVSTSCVSSTDATTESESALSFGSAGDPADATTTVEVSALDSMRFSPGAVDVERGEIVLFVVTNEGNLPHEFTLGDEAEQERHAEEMSEPGMTGHDHPFSVWLESGETKELAWEFSEGGELLYGCHVPGHYEAGMVGTIHVS